MSQDQRPPLSLCFEPSNSSFVLSHPISWSLAGNDCQDATFLTSLGNLCQPNQPTPFHSYSARSATAPSKLHLSTHHISPPSPEPHSHRTILHRPLRGSPITHQLRQCPIQNPCRPHTPNIHLSKTAHTLHTHRRCRGAYSLSERRRTLCY